MGEALLRSAQTVQHFIVVGFLFEARPVPWKIHDSNLSKSRFRIKLIQDHSAPLIVSQTSIVNHGEVEETHPKRFVYFSMFRYIGGTQRADAQAYVDFPGLGVRLEEL